MLSVLSLPDRSGLKAPFSALHHVALITNDMDKTVAFYRDVLGSEVALTHRMPRADYSRHYFITVAPNTVFAFFEFPDAELPEFKPQTQVKTGRALDHIAFFVEDEAALKTWHERLQGQVDHQTEIFDLGFLWAFFFADPNGITLEIAAEKPGRMRFPQFTDPDPVSGLPASKRESQE